MALSNNPISHVLLLFCQKLLLSLIFVKKGSLSSLLRGLRFIDLAANRLFGVLAFVKLDARYQVLLVVVFQLGVGQYQLPDILFSVRNDVKTSKCVIFHHN